MRACPKLGYRRLYILSQVLTQLSLGQEGSWLPYCEAILEEGHMSEPGGPSQATNKHMVELRQASPRLNVTAALVQRFSVTS